MAIVMLCVMLPIRNLKVEAIGNFPVSAIADCAEKHADLTNGGPCKVFVTNVVFDASGGTINIGGGYQDKFASLGVEVNSGNAIRGDIIQITPAGSDDSSAEKLYKPKETSKQLHTAIILNNYGGGNFYVIDSNYSLNPDDNLVRHHRFNPYASATGSIIKIWRLGTAPLTNYNTGDIITFGSYPQTKVSNIALISELNAQTLQTDNTVTYEGTKYKRVYFTQYTPYYTTGMPNSGSSWQDNNGYYINIVYWLKYEPIRWRVLSNTNGELFVMTDKILDSRAYNQVDADVTWETCTMRSWLNNDFFNAAFNSTEQAKIETSTVVNEVNPWYGTTGGNNTNDKLFLLSYSEAMNPAYGFSSSIDDDAAREAQGTDYSKSQGLFVYTDCSCTGNSNWWLRSSGYCPENAGVVGGFGYVDGNDKIVIYTYFGVRPACRINQTSANTLTSSVTLNTNCLTWPVGKSGTFMVTITPSNTSNKSVTWATSNKNVATISIFGQVTAINPGIATITCTTADGSCKKATCSITVVPQTPVFFAATKASSTSIKTSWTAVNGVTGYYLFRATSKTGTYSNIKTLTATTYTNTGLTKGKSYYYKVQAYKIVCGTTYRSASTTIASATL